MCAPHRVRASVEFGEGEDDDDDDDDDGLGEDLVAFGEGGEEDDDGDDDDAQGDYVRWLEEEVRDRGGGHSLRHRQPSPSFRQHTRPAFLVPPQLEESRGFVRMLLRRVDRLEERRRERGETKPRKGKEGDPWEKVRDEETGEYFWMNIDTGEQRLEEEKPEM